MLSRKWVKWQGVECPPLSPIAIMPKYDGYLRSIHLSKVNSSRAASKSSRCCACLAARRPPPSDLTTTTAAPPSSAQLKKEHIKTEEFSHLLWLAHGAALLRMEWKVQLLVCTKRSLLLSTYISAPADVFVAFYPTNPRWRPSRRTGSTPCNFVLILWGRKNIFVNWDRHLYLLPYFLTFLSYFILKAF